MSIMNVKIPLFNSGDIIKSRNGVSPHPAPWSHYSRVLYAAEAGRVW